jgi:hypothetical protein
MPTLNPTSATQSLDLKMMGIADVTSTVSPGTGMVWQPPLALISHSYVQPLERLSKVVWPSGPIAMQRSWSP